MLEPMALNIGVRENLLLLMTIQNGDPRKEVIALGQTYFAIGICKIVFVKHHLWSTIKP